MSSNIEAAARAWLASLEEAGLTQEQAVADLEAVARSYSAEGRQDLARQILEIAQRYRMKQQRTAAETEAARLIVSTLPKGSTPDQTVS